MNGRRVLRPSLAAAAALLASSCSARAPIRESSPSRPATVATVESSGRPSVDPILDTARTIVGEGFDYPAGSGAQVIAQIVTMAPGQSTGWHRHAVPTFGYILAGHLDLEYDGKGRRVLGPGDRLMEAMRVAHNAVNLGTTPVRILAVFMGAQGKPTVIKADPPSMPAELAMGRPIDLVDLARIDPSLRLDLRYATADNFTGQVIYPVARALMQRPAAEALRRANAEARRAGFALSVLDAYRPWSVTRRFWDSFPMHRAFLADPLAGSRHNRGCAVDVTLVNLASGAEVKMPSAYDEFSERAHPAFGGGTPEETQARDLLRHLMEAQGFRVYDNEWWHFDYQGWQDYPVLDAALDVAVAGD